MISAPRLICFVVPLSLWGLPRILAEWLVCVKGDAKALSEDATALAARKEAGPSTSKKNPTDQTLCNCHDFEGHNEP